MDATQRATSKHSIVIVEPNEVLGESLKHYLEHKGFTVSCVVENVRGLASHDDTSDETTILLNGARGDIVADFTLLKATRSKARIIVYGGRSELKTTLEAIQSGATVYLDDRVNVLMFLKSLELAAHGFVTVSVTVRGETVQSVGGKEESALENAPLSELDTAAAARAIAQQAVQMRKPFELPAREPVPTFSPREASILQLLREGAPNKLIARQLSLTEATVKVHLKSILRKIRVNNRTQAAVWAMGQPTFSNSPGK